VTAPGLGSSTDPGAAAAAQQPYPAASELPPGQESPLDRPEVRIGLAFGGAFIAARILKRIFD
jgi:hypothetical protein